MTCPLTILFQSFFETFHNTPQKRLISFQKIPITEFLLNGLIEQHVILPEQFFSQLRNLPFHTPRFSLFHAIVHQLGNPNPQFLILVHPLHDLVDRPQ